MDRDAADHCRELVRQHDRDRFLSALFAPEHHRDALMTLYAFDIEINRIAVIVSDPMPGEIRLQWWSDTLGAIEHGSIEGHPVASALRSAIDSYNLPVQPLLDLIEAHRFDLYNDPMPSLTDLEGYAGETVSAILQLCAIILSDVTDPEPADVSGLANISGHAGAAIGICKVLRALPRDVAGHRVYLPADVLDRHGLDREDLLQGGEQDRVGSVVGELCDHVRHHLKRFSQAFEASGSAAVAPAYLQTGLLPAFLKALQKSAEDPRQSVPEIPQWRRQWSLWRTARKLSR